MTSIVPTVTADNAHIYREEVERVQAFAKRLHIDLADGQFAPTKLINPIQAWWPDSLVADIHMMYKHPAEHLETLISLQPNLVILHVEADDDIAALLSEFQSRQIKAGVALLEQSQPADFQDLIAKADHVLIFGGKLGYHGGEAQLEHLQKVEMIRQIKPGVEISWDGGIGADNARQLVDSGIDVLNVGGFIQRSENPARAYQQLVDATS